MIKKSKTKIKKKEKAKISVVAPIQPNREIEALPFIKKQDPKCIPIFEESRSASRNRNVGASRAKTDFVAFINMHTMLSDDWSKEVLAFFKKYPKIDAVGGPHLTPKKESYFGRLSGYVLGSIFGAAGSSARYNLKKEILDADEQQLTAANLVCKRAVTKKIKFDETLYPGEDPNFIKEAKQAGFKVAYSPKIIAYQRRRDKFKDFMRQVFYYGYARPRKETFSETLKWPTYLIPSLFVIYLALLPTLFLLSKHFLWPLAAYAGLSILFSLYLGLRNLDIPAIIILPFLFLSVHLSYGLGFLYGMLSRKPKGNSYTP